MKKKIIAISLSAALALSATPAFAAEKTISAKECFDFNSLFNSYKVDCPETKDNTNVFNKLMINGKSIDWKSFNWKSTDCNTPNCNISDCKTADCKTNDCQTTDCKTSDCKTTDCKSSIKTTAAKPAAVKPSVKLPTATKPVKTQPAITNPVKNEPTTYAPIKNSTEKDSLSNTTVSSSNLNYEQKVVELVNIERQKNGLSALTLDSKISNVARTKSKDMAANNYFAHQSPTYGSAGSMLKQFGVNWSAWGENIASGQRTPEAVVSAWMNSEGHRANILSSNFSKIGVGYATNSNGTPYWTQMFTN